MKIMVNNSTRLSKFAVGLEQVTFYIYDCSVREGLYLAGEPSGDSEDLKKHILSLYKTVLLFLLKARIFYEASTTSV